MYKEVGVLLLLVLLEFSGQVLGECRFSHDYIQNSLGTFTTNDVHGKLQLLRFGSVDEGTILGVLCREDGGKIVTHNIGCRRGSLNPIDPIRCVDTIVAKVHLTDKDNSCPASMYRIGIEIQNEFLELYRACYDKGNVRSYFSEATIYRKKIHSKLKARPRFSTDELITPAQEASFQTKNIYKTFVKTYGSNQKYMKKDENGRPLLLINRGHLTASSDMLFADQMTSTFKYLNVVPQFESINSGNWMQIEHWVGNNIPEKSFVHLRTGAFGLLSLQDTKSKPTMQPAFLIPDKKQNPVPEWMYKIVRDANNRLLHVFLTYNNIFNLTKPKAHECCKTVACPLKLEDSSSLGFTYCCEPQQFVECVHRK
ncbi:uncharacterized protein LOC117790069 [Drosophila innubila]|uniref:uncharacterized protein LOC117790069 n=1 Tax=Drosophila innubila TaxID=198719 RepID=UPI00148DC064|nr:uncharacterized protein LOC117790069 [Drosophila innubila]